MNKAKIIGISFVTTPFIIIFIVSWKSIGLYQTSIGFVVSTALALMLAAGVSLIVRGRIELP